MGTALKPYEESRRAQQHPVSFEVSAAVAESQPLSLPISTRESQASLVHRPSSYLAKSTSIHLQPQPLTATQSQPRHSARQTFQRSSQPQTLHLQPQLKVTSSVVRVPEPVQPRPQRAVVKPLPMSRVQPRWLVSLRVAQRCSAIVATGLVATALVVYGSTVYTQQQWGSQYSELTQAEKERSLMDAFGESLKQNYAEQASQPGSPLSGRPTPYYKIPLEPQPLRPTLEVPPEEEPEPQRLHNFPKGY